jgi:predicted secreted hydrolase
MGTDSVSAYYSRTRMTATGTLTVAGSDQPVSGEAWFDHQWGNFSNVGLGLDWFPLRLSDDSELMLYDTRDATGNALSRYATLVSPDGKATTLSDSEFFVEATGTWTSPGSGGIYPMGWKIRVPSRNMDLTLTPVLESAEFNALATTRNHYWEGAVTISGSHSGVGYAELVGYAPVSFTRTQPRQDSDRRERLPRFGTSRPYKHPVAERATPASQNCAERYSCDAALEHV